MVKRHKKLNKNYISKKTYSITVSTILILIGLISIYPVYYIFLGAVSDPSLNSVPYLYPKGFDLNQIKMFLNIEILNAMGNTFFLTIVGGLFSLFLTVSCAYVLSQKNVPGVKLMTIIVMMTIWIKPGMIAIFSNIENMSLKNSMWGIILPFSFSAFNVILLRTAFMGIPTEIMESAEIDGASKIRTLFSIVLPNSIPALTTVGLFHIIDRWNGYFWAELLLDQEKYPLQVFVKNALTNEGKEAAATLTDAMINAQAYSLILIAVLPMIIIFPFIQKSFKKGIMSGSVK